MGHEGEEYFFDACEEVSSASLDCSDGFSGSEFDKHVSNTFKYEFWTNKMDNVHERRERFLGWMGLNLSRHRGESEELSDYDERKLDTDWINKCGELVHSDLIDGCMSNGSLLSCQMNEASVSSQADAKVESSMQSIRNLDDGSEFLVDELGPDGMLSKLRIVGSDKMVTAEEFQRAVGSSAFVQQLLQKKSEKCKLVDVKKKVKSSFLGRLGAIARKVDKKGEVKSKHGNRIGSVRVHSHKKHLKELSSVHTEQDFLAHEGSILAMKFSHDGQYLATGGEDSVVRVWKIVEDERQNTVDILDDPSCLYFSLNHFSKLSPLNVDKEMIGRVKKMSKSKSSCVILPPKIFRVMEKPLYEFHGHSGDVLALSWSMKGHLLSSSVDKTVRIWQIGHHQCLGVFSHNNYVTCVEFNPVDDNHFISGSIDGKVRIWEVERCQVVDWIDIKEIVTAVCYYPNGKQSIVGTMDGNCHFYDIIDDRLHMGAQISLQGKKKFTGKRVTGFQFCPSDLSKVMVTSADSQVRILSGVNVMCKFKGTRKSGSLMSASFTSDGKHIISVSEDSNVFMWNYNGQEQHSSTKNIVSSESFSSHNAAVAIPWCIPKALPSPNFSGDDHAGSVMGNKHLNDDLQHKIPGTSPDCFSLSRGFSLESLYRSPPTWPEENLPSSSPKAVSRALRRFEYKFLKTALHNTFNSPNLWGLVIVTAGWDGRIRSYLNHGLPILL